MESDAYRLTVLGGYIYLLNSLISESFNSCLCNFVPKSCNKVVHALAAEGSSCNNGAELPSCVSELVASEIWLSH
jgi:hypothetical protein